MPNGQWTAISTPHLGSYTPANMMDGSLNTFFHTDMGTQAYQWIQVNFGKIVEVIIIYAY